MDSGKPKPKGLFRFTHTIIYSIDGLKAAWKLEESFRQELILFFIMTPVAFLVGNSVTDYILLIGSLWILVIVELINSSIEATVDRIGLEKHELSKRAKDIGSAAVMFTIFLVLGIWGTMLWCKFY
jgi:diacylglycerol kinase (ATP)